MTTPRAADEAVDESKKRIAWVLDHPRMSGWLKDALRSAEGRNPEHLLNDLEILTFLLKARCESAIEETLRCRSRS